MALGNLNTYLVDADEGFDETSKAQRWFLTCAIPERDWFTKGTMVGQPVFGATSAVTATDAIFASWMVGSYMKFNDTGNEYPVVGFTSTTVLTLTGDASGETSDDGFTVVHGYTILPDRFDSPPAAPNAFPAKLSIEGTCLKRRVNFTERPGFVTLYLTYGWDLALVADNSAYITMRTILVETELKWSLDDTPKQMTGEVFIANKTSLRVYGVKGASPMIEIPYQIVRIYALLDNDKRTLYAKSLVHKAGAVNDESWTFGGMTFLKETLKFRGVTLDYSRRWGQSADHRIYNTVFEFIERPIAWPLTVDRYEWKRVVLNADLVDDDAVVVGPARIAALVPINDTLQACIIRPTYTFDDVLGSSTIPNKLVS